MKFGIPLYPYDMYGNLAEVVRVVERAEALGFDFVSFPEHVAPTPAVNEQLSNRLWPDFPALASFLAARTRRIEFVSAIYLLPLCNPLRLAKQLATLDELSGGRVILGVGVGWNPQEFEAMGVPFAERAAITDEYIVAMKALWSSEPASFSGRYLRFEDVSSLPKPTRGSIRILSGGAAARGPLERVARLCDGWMPWKIARSDLPAAIEQLRVALSAAGRRLEDIDVTWNVSLGVNPALAKARLHAAPAGAKPSQPDKPLPEELHDLEALGVTRTRLSFPAASPDALIAALERFAAEHIT